MTIIAIIPARGGSKKLPRKNIRLLNGRPLIYYTIKAAQKSKYLERIIVSTEDKEIAEIAKRLGAEVINRPRELARDETPTLPVLQHVIHHLEEKENCRPDVIVILQPTSPLRTPEDIDAAVKKFRETKCDSVVSVCEVEHPIEWMYTLDRDRMKPLMKDGARITRRQDAPMVYRLNGAVYVTRRETITQKNTVLAGDLRAYVMPPERSIDIDTEMDFKLAELILRESRRV